MQNKENNTGVSAIGSSILHPFSNTATSWRISLSSFVRTPLFSCQLHSILSLFSENSCQLSLATDLFFFRKGLIVAGNLQKFSLSALSAMAVLYRSGPGWVLTAAFCQNRDAWRQEQHGWCRDPDRFFRLCGDCQGAGKEWCLQDGKDNSQGMINLLLEGTESYWNC